MYKIVMDKGEIHVDMPLDIGLRLFEACYRADLYKHRNASAVFTVVNMENGDIEYQI